MILRFGVQHLNQILHLRVYICMYTHIHTQTSGDKEGEHCPRIQTPTPSWQQLLLRLRGFSDKTLIASSHRKAILG